MCLSLLLLFSSLSSSGCLSLPLIFSLYLLSSGFWSLSFCSSLPLFLWVFVYSCSSILLSPMGLRVSSCSSLLFSPLGFRLFSAILYDVIVCSERTPSSRRGRQSCTSGAWRGALPSWAAVFRAPSRPRWRTSSKWPNS